MQAQLHTVLNLATRRDIQLLGLFFDMRYYQRYVRDAVVNTRLTDRIVRSSLLNELTMTYKDDFPIMYCRTKTLEGSEYRHTDGQDKVFLQI